MTPDIIRQAVDRKVDLILTHHDAWDFMYGMKEECHQLLRHYGIHAHEAGCDVYITGEKTLYTIQYAQYIGMNLIVGSHTFTEIFGVRSLAAQISEQFPDIEMVALKEAHFE